MVVNFNGAHFPQEIILMGVHWYGLRRSRGGSNEASC
jgi:hypothetical protein